MTRNGIKEKFDGFGVAFDENGVGVTFDEGIEIDLSDEDDLGGGTLGAVMPDGRTIRYYFDYENVVNVRRTRSGGLEMVIGQTVELTEEFLAEEGC